MPSGAALLELGALGVALGADAFALAAAIGVNGLTSREKLRIASGFGAFQAVMPLAGLLLGRAAEALTGASSVVGGILLIAIGLHMLLSSLGRFSIGSHLPSGSRRRGSLVDHRSLTGLLLLSLGVSIDALLAGFGLGFLEVELLTACTIIGLITFLMSSLGVELGRTAGRFLGDRAETFSGIVFVLIGVRFLL